MRRTKEKKNQSVLSLPMVDSNSPFLSPCLYNSSNSAGHDCVLVYCFTLSLPIGNKRCNNIAYTAKEQNSFALKLKDSFLSVIIILIS